MDLTRIGVRHTALQAFAKWLVDAGIPMHALRRELFISLRNVLGLPDSINANSIADQLPGIAFNAVANVYDQLQSSKSVSIIIDNTYHYQRGVNFLGVIARWVEPAPFVAGFTSAPVIKHAALALVAHPCGQPCNRETQWGLLEPVLNLYGLREKVNYFVSDHGSDIANIHPQVAGWIGCSSHALHLVGHNLDKIPVVQAAVVRARELAAFQRRHGSLWSQVWRQHVASLGIIDAEEASNRLLSPPQLRSPVQTRWTSVDDVLQSILDAQAFILSFENCFQATAGIANAAAKLRAWREVAMADDEFVLLQQLLRLFRVLTTASTKMQEQNLSFGEGALLFMALVRDLEAFLSGIEGELRTAGVDDPESDTRVKDMASLKTFEDAIRVVEFEPPPPQEASGMGKGTAHGAAFLPKETLAENKARRGRNFQKWMRAALSADEEEEGEEVVHIGAKRSRSTLPASTAETATTATQPNSPPVRASEEADEPHTKVQRTATRAMATGSRRRGRPRTAASQTNTASAATDEVVEVDRAAATAAATGDGPAPTVAPSPPSLERKYVASALMVVYHAAKIAIKEVRARLQGPGHQLLDKDSDIARYAAASAVLNPKTSLKVKKWLDNSDWTEVARATLSSWLLKYQQSFAQPSPAKPPNPAPTSVPDKVSAQLAWMNRKHHRQLLEAPVWSPQERAKVAAQLIEFTREQTSTAEWDVYGKYVEESQSADTDIPAVKAVLALYHHFLSAPPTTTAVERSFNKISWMMADERRHNVTARTVAQKYLICVNTEVVGANVLNPPPPERTRRPQISAGQMPEMFKIVTGKESGVQTAAAGR